MPVVRLDDVGHEAATSPRPMAAARGASAAKRMRVVRPISPSRSAIGSAGPRIEMRRVEHEQVEPRGAPASKPRRSAVQFA